MVQRTVLGLGALVLAVSLGPALYSRLPELNSGHTQQPAHLAGNSVVLPSQRPAYLARNSVVLPSQRPAYLAANPTAANVLYPAEGPQAARPYA